MLVLILIVRHICLFLSIVLDQKTLRLVILYSWNLNEFYILSYFFVIFFYLGYL